jgi:uncharacterized protein YjbJ (UPF0337 family)
METTELQSNWKDLKNIIKKKWHKLSDDDLTEAKGNVETIVTKIADRYDINKEKAQRKLKKYLKNIDIPHSQLQEYANKFFGIAYALRNNGLNLTKKSFKFIKGKPLISAGILIGATAIASMFIKRPNTD